jgi:hypothetical protein
MTTSTLRPSVSSNLADFMLANLADDEYLGQMPLVSYWIRETNMKLGSWRSPRHERCPGSARPVIAAG